MHIITENKNKQYSHRQVNQNSNRLFMDGKYLIMIVNNPELLGKSCHPHDWMFEYRKPRNEELKLVNHRSEEVKYR